MDKLAVSGLKKQDIERITTEEFSSLPHILLRCLDMCQASRVDVEQLASIINMDGALVARLFSLADFSQIDEKNTSGLLVQVLDQLGLSTVKAVIKSVALSQVFKSLDSSQLSFLKIFWEHSLYTALSARFIAQRIGYYNEEEAYLAALMHDIGQIVQVNKYGSRYVEFFIDNQKIEDKYLEKKEFGTGHNQIGSQLIRQWRWSSLVADAVEYHHEPLEAVKNAHQLVKIVSYANCMAHRNDHVSLNAGQELFGFNKNEIAEIQVLVEEQLLTISERIDLESSQDSFPSGGIELQPIESQQLHGISAVISERDIKKQSLLAAKIFDMGLVDQASNILDDVSENMLYLSVLKGANVLFGLKQGLVFLYDEMNGLISVHSTNKGTAIDNFGLPLEEGSSLVANALIRNEITDSFTSSENSTGFDEVKIVDLQIARFFEKPGIVCLPLVDVQKSHIKKVGVLVFAVDENLLTHVRHQQNLVYAYLQNSAEAIAVFHLEQNQDSLELSNELVNYKAKIRSMVHEVNNPLTIVRQYLELLRQKLPEDVDLDGEINVLKEEVQRAANILSSSHEYKTSIKNTDGCNINLTLESLLNLFDETLLKPNSISMDINLDRNIPILDIDTDKFKQVVGNLLKNSAEELIAASSNDKANNENNSGLFLKKELKISTQDRIVVNGGHYVEIIIQDNGGGIANDVMLNLFRPIQSSKGYGHQGLGLSIVRNLIEEMNGFISCKSSTSSGTIFQILLPRKTLSSELIH